MAATPADQDREGIENLCKQLFKYVNIDLKDFAELLIGQNYVTTVLKVSSYIYNRVINLLPHVLNKHTYLNKMFVPILIFRKRLMMWKQMPMMIQTRLVT